MDTGAAVAHTHAGAHTHTHGGTASARAGSHVGASARAKSSATIVLGAYTAAEAAMVTAVVAAQMDARFVAMDLTHGSRIQWDRVAADVNQWVERLLAQQAAEAKGEPRVAPDPAVSNMPITRREWSPQQCQRVWRWAAYGDDVGDRAELLPDSDGEDEPQDAKLTRTQIAALPTTSATEAREIIVSTLTAIAEKVAAAARADAHGTVHTGDPVVDGCGLSIAAHQELDNALREICGPRPPVRKTAAAIFCDQFRADAHRVADGRPSVSTLVEKLAPLEHSHRAHPDMPELQAEVTALRERIAVARRQEADNVLAEAWKKLAQDAREEFVRKERVEERRWIDECRAWNLRYSELYRLIARQVPVLLQRLEQNAAAAAAAGASAASAPAGAPASDAGGWSKEVEAILASTFARPLGRLLPTTVSVMTTPSGAPSKAQSGKPRNVRPRMTDKPNRRASSSSAEHASPSPDAPAPAPSAASSVPGDAAGGMEVVASAPAAAPSPSVAAPGGLLVPTLPMPPSASRPA